MKTVLAGVASVVAALALAVVLFGQAGVTSANAAIHGISAAPSSTANAGGEIVLSIDADDTKGDVTVVTTAGEFTAAVCTDDAVGTTSEDCALSPDDPSGETVFSDAAVAGKVTSFIVDDSEPHTAAVSSGGTDLVTVTFECPTPGPASPTVSAIQANSVSTASLTCRGNVASVTVEPRIQTGLKTNTEEPGCAATDVACAVRTSKATSYIESTSATTPTAPGVARAVAANLYTTAKDSAGNLRDGITVVYITSDGSLVDADDLDTAQGFDTTGAIDGADPALGVAWDVSLVHGTNGATGDVANITVNAAGVTATAEVTFAGDAVACDVTAASSSVASGGSTQVTANFWSNSEKTVPVPDYHTILAAGSVSGDPDISAVNAVGEGTFAVTGQTPVVGGVSTATITVGASGGTGVLATMGGTSTTCNTTVSVSTTVAPPSGGGGGTGDGSIAGTLPTSGFGLVTFGGTVDQLKTALATACPSGAPIFATSGGAFVGYFSTTTLEAPNAAFLALYGASGLPANTPLLGGNC